MGYHQPVPLSAISISGGDVPLAHLGDALNRALEQHGGNLPDSVAATARVFSLAVESAVRAQDDTDLIRNLIRHHERVQSGKLDASRQPKLTWMELRENDVVVAPRYALDERPDQPGSIDFTHPYRIEQFADMLREAGAWEAAS